MFQKSYLCDTEVDWIARTYLAAKIGKYGT
jgi:hypothetical protein